MLLQFKIDILFLFYYILKYICPRQNWIFSRLQCDIKESF